MAILAKSQITITDLWDGIDGAPGTSSYFHVKYSPVANPTSAQMSDEIDTYIGTYVDENPTDSTDPKKYQWIKIEGLDGTNGVPGKDGVNGQTSYLHIKYSDNVLYDDNGIAHGSFTENNGEVPGAFIGQYVDFLLQDSSDFNKYKWYKVKGEVGPVGPQGVPGKATYTWVKYADDANGTNMSDSPTGKEYIGMAYNKDVPTESSVAKDYIWAKFKGSDGIPGAPGVDGKTYYTWLKYADTPTTGMSDSPDGKKYMGVAYNKTTQTESTSYSDYSWSLIKGADGIPGITYYTWIRYADDANGGGISNSPVGKSYIGFAYQKTSSTESNTPGDYKWSLIKGEQGVPGLPGANGQTTYTWIKYSDSLNPTTSAQIYDVPKASTMTIGIAVNKTTATEGTTPSDYTWSRFKGETGATGAEGVAYTINITGGTRGIAYAADGTGPSPATSTEFTAQLLKNGKAQTTISSCSWSVGGVFTSGTVGSTNLKYTPRISTTVDTKNIPSTFVTVSIKPSANEEAVVQTVPIVVTANADGLDWLADWNTGKTTIKDKSIASPRIFAGENTGQPNAPKLSGVALGKDVLAGSETQIGLVGYQENRPTFKLGTDGTFLVSREGSSGGVVNGGSAGIYFDGTNLSITGNVAIKGGSIGGSGITDIVNGANAGTDAKNELDNLEIGGRNYLRNSNFKDGTSNWLQLNGVKEYEGYKCAYRTHTTTTGESFIMSHRVAGLAGKKIVLSFLSAFEGVAQKEIEVFILAKKVGSSKDWDYAPNKKQIIGNTLTTVTFEYTVPSDVDTLYIRFDNNATAVAPTTLYITNVKLEVGTKATDWTPAPEDSEVAVKTVDVEYASSTSSTTPPTTGWGTNPPTWKDGEFIWSRTTTTLMGGGSTTTEPVCITGAKGTTGTAGKGISSTTITYQASSSGTTAPTGTWSPSVPTLTAGQYLWTRTVIAFTDSTSTTSYSVSRSGTNGTNGADGKGIKSTAITYQASASGTVVPTGSWGSGVPTVPDGQYLWTRTIVTYTDNATSTSYSISKMGVNGTAGKGISAIQNYYLATSASSGVTVGTSGWTTTMQSMTTTNKYLWNYEKISYTTGNPTDTTPVIIGVHGTNGANGSNGTDGRGIVSIVEYYLVSPNSTGVTTSTSGWNTTIPTMTTTNKYLWNYEVISYTTGSPTTGSPKVIGAYGNTGAAGVSAKYVIVTGEQTFKYINNFTGNPTPTTIKLTSSLVGTTGYQWSYRTPGSATTTNISGATASTYDLTHNNTIWGAHKQLTLRCTSGGVYDEITVVKVSDGTNGTNGTNGATGAAGKDAYTVILTNESHTFAGGVTSALAGNAKCEIIAYKGATRVAATIGTISGLVTGLTAPITSNGTTSAYFTPTVTTSMTTKNGVLTVPITVDGNSFTKNFTYSLALAGATGSPGATGAIGQGVQSITELYKILDVKTQQPTPTSDSGWSTTPPTWSSGKYIHTCSKIVYKNPTATAYTTPVCDSSWEAVNELEFGGRNLVRKAQFSLSNEATGSFDSNTNTWTLTATPGSSSWGRGISINNPSDNKIIIPYGKGAIYSWEMKVPTQVTWNTDVNNGPVSGSAWSGNDNDNSSKRKTSNRTITKTNEWVKCWSYVENTSSSNTNKIDIKDVNSNFGVVTTNATSNITFYIRNFKVELGNRPTDWSPCPEDVDAAAKAAKDAADAAASAAKTANDKHAEAANDNKLTAIEKQQAKKEWDIIVGEKSKIDAEADKFAVSKTAYGTAYNNLNTYITPLLANLTTTSDITGTTYRANFKNYYDARQDILNAISTKAKDLADGANSKIDGLEIGGTNLVLNSAPVTTGWSWAGTAGTASLVDETTSPSGKAMKATFTAAGGSGGMHKSPKSRLVDGKKYSWSVWIKGSKNMTMNLGHEQNGRKEVSITTNWQKFTHTFTANNYSYQSFTMYALNVAVGDYYLAHSIKVEEGSKPTAWTVAPEDTQAAIDSKLNDKQDAIFNRLFTNGTQGFVLEGGKVYINGEVIKANAISGNAIKAGTITADQLSIGFGENGGYSKNPTFKKWGSSYPDGTSGWVDGGISKVSVDSRNVAQFVCSATSQNGMYLNTSFFGSGLNLDGPQYFVVECKFRLTSGTNPNGAAVLIDIYRTDNTSERMQMNLNRIGTSLTTNTWYSCKQVFKLADANVAKTFKQMQGYCLANYSGAGALTAKTIQFASVNVYKATEQDYLTQTWTSGTEINGASIKTGTLSASKITTGTLDASKATITNLNASNITTGTLAAARINAKGLLVKNSSNETTFSIDSNGNVSMKGSMTITGGSVPSSILSGTIDNARLNSSIVTGASNGTSAKGTLDSNSTNWTNAYNRVVQWASGAVSGSTTINGGLIATNTITAEKIAVGDFNNYSQLAKGKNLSNMHGSFTWTGSGDHYYWATSTNYAPFTVDGTKNPFTNGDEVVFDFELYAATAKDGVSIGVWFYSGDDGGGYLASNTVAFNIKTGWNRYRISVPINSPKVVHAKTVAIMIQNHSHRIEVRNVVINRKLRGEFIVDGTITANKLNVTDLTALGATIGGFSIKDGAIYSTNVGMGRDGKEWAFWAGSNTSGSAPFRVGHAGNVVASNMTITGGSIRMPGGAITISGGNFSPGIGGGYPSGSNSSMTFYKDGMEGTNQWSSGSQSFSSRGSYSTSGWRVFEDNSQNAEQMNYDCCARGSGIYLSIGRSGGNLEEKARLSVHQGTSLIRVDNVESFSLRSRASGYRSIELSDHSGHTWFRNDTNFWTFQGGTGGDDWTQSFSLRGVTSPGASNGSWIDFGQQFSNSSNGGYRGVSIRSYRNGGVTSGDITARAYLVNGNQYIGEGGNSSFRLVTNYGNVEIGPRNSGHCHYITDRSNHWFDKEIQIQGNLCTYNDGNVWGVHTYRGGNYCRMANGNNTSAMRIELMGQNSNYLFSTSVFYPNNSQALGASSGGNRWGQIYSTSGSISTSDSRVKESIKKIEKANTKRTLSNEATGEDMWSYVRNTSTYSYKYQRRILASDEDQKEWLGVLADEIPDNIFSKIGVVSKTQEKYEEELEKQAEYRELYKAELSKIPDVSEMRLSGDVKKYDIDGDYGNEIIKEIGLTRRELRDESEKYIEEPVRMLNSSAQIAMLQEVLSMALSKIESLEEKISILENQ